jgi:shikimate kinase
VERGKQVGDAPIFLIGYRGTGKTTVARELAARLGCERIDADDLVEERAGKSIAAIFSEDGETAFRNLEARVVAELCDCRRTVVALGGGAILREASRQAIQGAGPVVWLTARADTLLDRIAADPATAGRRPSLTQLGDREEIDRLLAERTPFYRQCATLTVDTEGKTAADVAAEIVSRL